MRRRGGSICLGMVGRKAQEEAVLKVQAFG